MKLIPVKEDMKRSPVKAVAFFYALIFFFNH